MKRRAILVALSAAATLAPLRVLGQKPPTNVRVGMLVGDSATTSAARNEALRAGLRDLGYVEGKNLTFEIRYADSKYERLTELAADLVRAKVDVIVTYGTPPTRAAKQATSTVPIVMASSGDAVGAGLVTSLARPGGNVTGFTFLSPEVAAKRVELIKETLPRAKLIGYMTNPANSVTAENMKAINATAATLAINVRRFDMADPAQLPQIFENMAASRPDAFAIGADPTVVANFQRIAALALKHRLPSIGAKEFAEAGGLLGYSHDQTELWRRTANYVDKIARGAKPADLPVERPTKFELVVNMKTARALGVTIPQTILARADKVIE